MKNILTLSISISIFYMSLNCKILNSSQANSDISLRIINDLVKSWYSPLIKSDVCYEDTLNIFINDTLTWRRPKLLSSDTIQQILSFFNIIPERYEAQIISDKRTSYPDFLKKRGVISNYASTMGCKMYYFSQAYKTSTSTDFIIHYYATSFESEEEQILLMELKGDKFVVKREIDTKITFF